MENLQSKVKKGLRIAEANTHFDDDIKDLIAAAMIDLHIAGKDSEIVDELVLQAIVAFAKVHFGSYEPNELARLERTYVQLKHNIALSGRYTAHAE